MNHFAVGNVSDYIRAMESGVFDFTENGECSNCGSCCSDFLPVSNREILRIRSYIQKNGIHEQKHFLPTRNPMIDMTCPFRDNLGHRCVIYEVRPAICRDFRCDKPRKKIEADKAMYFGKYSAVSMRQVFFPTK